jgi:hypothetical protein
MPTSRFECGAPSSTRVALARGAAILACVVLAACQREAPHTTAAPLPPPPPAAQSVPATAPAGVPTGTYAPSLKEAREAVAMLARGAEMALGQAATCLAHTAETPSRSIAVHRWVDGAGITHYSDLPPVAGVRDHRVIEVRGLPPISVQAAGYDVNLPDQLQQRAIADAVGVQRVLRDVLGVGAPAGLTLRVVFVQSPETYARLIGDASLAASAGAYSAAQRTIFVRMQAQEEASFAVLRHEITHALVHESIGNLPTPINEGLAEYFGRYRVGGLGGQVDVGADRAALIAAAPGNDEAGALVDLLARDGANFYVEDAGASSRERRYLRAYALVALLMQNAQDRAALAGVLAEQRGDPCRPVAAERILDMRYRGGLGALSAAWASFMRNPSTSIQAY